jgi:hypothetical protein
MKKGTAKSANLSMLLNMTWCSAVAGTLPLVTRKMHAESNKMRKKGKPRASRSNGSR